MSDQSDLEQFASADSGGERQPAERESEDPDPEEHGTARFPSLPTDWEIKRLDEVATVQGGSTPSTDEDEYWGGDILWATPTDLTELQGNTISDTEDKITEAGLESTSTHVLPPYSVLLTSRASIGKCAVNTVPMATNQGFQSLIPGEKLNTWYLYYVITEMAPYLESLGAGSTFSEISKREVQRVQIPVPPMEEQLRIATILYQLDENKSHSARIQDRIDKISNGLESRIFTTGISDDTVIEKFREQTVPSHWEFEPLEKFTVESAFGPRFNSERYDKKGDIATLRTTDLDDSGRISYETMPLADLDESEVEGHILEEGDFLITRSGTVGIATVWDGYDMPTIPGAFLIRFRLTSELNAEYLKYYINSPIGRRRVSRRAKGGVQKNLSGGDLLNMKIPVPPVKEQEEIIDILHNIYSYNRVETERENRLGRLLAGVRREIVSGEIRTDNRDIKIHDEVRADD